MSKIVFLDTNVYLHCQPFYQVNWLDIVGAKAVTIVLPPIIIRELNKHKDTSSRPRVRRRAGATLKKLA